MSVGQSAAVNGRWDAARAREIIEAHLALEGPMIPILHALQEAFGYVDEAAVPQIAQALNLSRAEVHGVVSFYHDFRRAPAGRHALKLCRAEACQSVGCDALHEKLLHRLGLDWGATTPDGALTIEPVYCLGLCATGPSAMIDGRPVGRLTETRLDKLVASALSEEARP